MNDEYLLHTVDRDIDFLKLLARNVFSKEELKEFSKSKNLSDLNGEKRKFVKGSIIMDMFCNTNVFNQNLFESLDIFAERLEGETNQMDRMKKYRALLLEITNSLIGKGRTNRY